MYPNQDYQPMNPNQGYQLGNPIYDNQMWYVIINGQQSGPHPYPTVCQMGITPTTMVWREGMAEWRNASEMVEFNGLFMSPQQYPQSYQQSKTQQYVNVNVISPYQHQQPRKEIEPSNRLATTGMTLSILGLVFVWFPFVNVILWMLGFVFSMIGVFRSPKGKAIAGLVLSGVSVCAFIIMLNVGMDILATDF